MIVGKINLDNGKQGRFIDFGNLVLALKDYYFERHHIVISCNRCGRMLCATTCMVGPHNCGWSFKNKEWYCHQCEYHGGESAAKSTKEKLEWKDSLETWNKDTKREMDRYKMHHPWIKWRYK